MKITIEPCNPEECMQPVQITIPSTPKAGMPETKKEQPSYVPTHKGMAAADDKKMLSAVESEAFTSEATTTTKAGPETTVTKASPK